VLAVKETEIAYAKLCEKILHNKRHNKRPPRGDEHKPCVNTSRLEISYKLTLFLKKSCFNFDVHVKERSESVIFFCGGQQLEYRTENYCAGCSLFDNLALSYVSLDRSRRSQISLDKFEKFIRCVRFMNLFTQSSYVYSI